MVDSWEHKVVVIDYDEQQPLELMRALKAEGSDRWELVAVLPVNPHAATNRARSRECYFKRPYRGEPWSP